MQEAQFYTKQKNKNVRCRLCNHGCVISPGKTGICGVRENQKGILYSLVYGKAIAGQVDPVEKKPLFHFLPGTTTYGVSTVGCNFRCQQCLNWSLTQVDDHSTLYLPEMAPAQLVATALEENCQSISFTYNEPTLNIEYNLEVMKLAREKGLRNIWVSNGYMTKEALETITPYLDATNIDLKGFTENFYQKVCQAKLKPLLDNLKLIKKLNKTWLEITTLIIPTLNDSPEELGQIAKFISEELGPETPWHVSRFSPEISWQLQDLPATPASTLKLAYEIGKKAGLKYIYVGNIPSLNLENTSCPKCGEVIIARHGYLVNRKDNDGKCQKCGEKIAGVFPPLPRGRKL